MVKSVLYFGIIALFSFSSIIAQNDPKAKEALDQMAKKAKSYSSVKVSFTYAMDNKDKNIHEKQNGVLTSKGGKYRISINGQEIISDSTTVWTYLKDANEVQITTAEYDDETISPATIFTIYQKGYKYKYVNEQSLNGKANHVIDLFPEQSRNFIKVRLFIDKTTLHLSKAEVNDKKGGIITYTITELSPNVKIDTTTFTFNKATYPGVEVVDLRE